MRRAGLVVWHALKIAEMMIRPGIKTIDIDARVERFFSDQQAHPLFKGYPGTKTPFPAVTCISVNEEVVHGIPGQRMLEEGDIVSIDTGCRVNGWCGDSANTYPVGAISEESKKLLATTQGMLDLAISLLPKCMHWSDVARKMETYARKNGFGVIESLVGHGIGREMHEEPQVPNYVYSDFFLAGDFKIQPGLVIAIEPMINAGSKQVKTLGDHWTIRTADRKRSAHFEHTVAVTRSGVVVLTGPPEQENEKIDITPYLSS